MEHIETKIPALRGITVIGKIELPQPKSDLPSPPTKREEIIELLGKKVVDFLYQNSKGVLDSLLNSSKEDWGKIIGKEVEVWAKAQTKALQSRKPTLPARTCGWIKVELQVASRKI